MTSTSTIVRANPTIVAILGAPDPEMHLIEAELRKAGVEIIYATHNGVRVRPDQAYNADPVPRFAGGMGEDIDTILRVECDWDGSYDSLTANVVVIDHHHTGDPGYGKGPDHFLTASSIGQTLIWLANHAPNRPELGHAGIELHNGQWTGGYWVECDDGGYPVVRFFPSVAIPQHIVLAAAADHALPHAYAGKCPGVAFHTLEAWRAESRAAFQKRPVGDVIADVKAARERIYDGRTIRLDCPKDEYDFSSTVTATDVRGLGDIPELPEACSQLGEAVVYDMALPDGKVKVGILAGSPEQVTAFMTVWAPTNGLVGVYGDPARGYAGGYKA